MTYIFTYNRNFLIPNLLAHMVTLIPPQQTPCYPNDRPPTPPKWLHNQKTRGHTNILGNEEANKLPKLGSTCLSQQKKPTSKRNIRNK